MKQAAHTDGTGLSTAMYDGLGRRVQVTESGTTRKIVYDLFGQLVAEYGGETLAGEPGGIKYIMSDHQGSARVILNSNATADIIARRDYRPFGEEIAANTGMRTSSQKYGFTDSTRQQYGATDRDKSGLDHTLWRKYESNSGRWTSPDPYMGSMSLLAPQSFNRYAYVSNDPVNYVDPGGLDDEPWDPGETLIINVNGRYQRGGAAGNHIALSHTTSASREGGGGFTAPPVKSDCETFVDRLIAAAEGTSLSKLNLGRRLGGEVLAANRARQFSGMSYTGFKAEFVTDQGGYAYAHIMGMAGAYLIGNDRIVPTKPETGFDRIKSQRGEDQKELKEAISKKDQRSVREKNSELADDDAGVEAGAVLESMMNGGLSTGEAKMVMMNRLCDY